MLFKSIVAAMFAVFSVAQEDRAPELAERKAAQQGEFVAAISRAAADAPRQPREWAALMLAVLEAETHGSLRIHEGRCKPLECDRGRARGPWQPHRNAHNRDVWDQLIGVENTTVQARVASDMLKRAYWRCAKSGVDWVTGTLNAYKGVACDSSWRGLSERREAYHRFLTASWKASGQ